MGRIQNDLNSSRRNPGVWITLAGIAEIAIAIGLQIQSLAPWVAVIAVVMLCCYFRQTPKPRANI